MPSESTGELKKRGYYLPFVRLMLPPSGTFLVHVSVFLTVKEGNSPIFATGLSRQEVDRIGDGHCGYVFLAKVKQLHALCNLAFEFG